MRAEINKYIKGFDGLRGISIIFVLITHLGLFEFLELSDSTMKRLVPLVSGGSGVTIFFVISGFLITKILMSEKEKAGRINFKNFFARRFLRLLPPLILYYISLALLMSLEIVKPNYIGFTFSALYLYNFVPKMYYTGELGPTWSLALEEQFYLFWPFVISFLKKNGVLILSCLMLLLSILSYHVYPLINIQFNGKIYVLTDFSHTQRWFIPAISSVLIGALSAYFFQVLSRKIIFQTRRSIAHILAVLLMTTTLYLPDSFLQFYTFFYAVGVAILILLIVTKQDSILPKLLEFSPLRYVGKISYGIYVYHSIFVRTAPTGTVWFQKFPMNIVITFLVAIISYHFYEKKILKFKSYFN